MVELQEIQSLKREIEAAEKAGVEKLITFEFSHFLSPNSMYLSAHNLYRRYQEWLVEEHQQISQMEMK